MAQFQLFFYNTISRSWSMAMHNRLLWLEKAV